MSTPSPSYVLDANVFIQAKRRFYPFDICPGYWDALSWHASQGVICSVDKVEDELQQGKDSLWDWTKTSFDLTAFRSTNNLDVITEFGPLMTWVQAQSQFIPAAKAQFATVADGWLIAYAKSTNSVVVTLEEHNPDTKKKVPMPTVCQAFGVEWITPFEMMRRLGIKLKWTAPT